VELLQSQSISNQACLTGNNLRGTRNRIHGW